MAIRATFIAGLLVAGSGAFALAQGGRVPGPPEALLQKPARTVLTTPLVAGGRFTCSLVNGSKSPLSLPEHAITIFLEDGEEYPYVDDSCSSELSPGTACSTDSAIMRPSIFTAYCQISFVGGDNLVRGAMQVWPAGDYVSDSFAIEAR
jgi:hypothetical protein